VLSTNPACRRMRHYPSAFVRRANHSIHLRHFAAPPSGGFDRDQLVAESSRNRRSTTVSGDAPRTHKTRSRLPQILARCCERRGSAGCAPSQSHLPVKRFPAAIQGQARTLERYTRCAFCMLFRAVPPANQRAGCSRRTASWSN